jgi:ankyrin repeat protein
LICRIVDGERVKTLIVAGVDIEGRGEYGKTALMVAAHHGKTDCVKVLIATGADVNAKDSEDGWMALNLAASSGSVDSLIALIAAGANVNGKRHSGFRRS